MKKLTFLIIGLGLLLALPQGLSAKGKPGGGGGSEPGHVSMTVTGFDGSDYVVDAFQDCAEQLDANITSYLCNKAGIEHNIMLGDFFTERLYDNGPGVNCFGVGYFNSVAIGLLVNNDLTAETVVRFHAFDKNGAEVLYVLRVNDPRGWNGTFPPAVGASTTMGELDSETEISWNLGATNKRQEKNACVDNGTFVTGSDFIKVEFTRID